METVSRHSTSPCEIITFLSSPPVLKFPDFDREFQVHVDASSSEEKRVGAFLAQPTKSIEVDIVAYYSQRFKSGQRH